MPRRVLLVLGYAALAAILGGVYWFMRGQHDPMWLSLWFGVCMVSAVVIGRGLRRRWRFKRATRG